MNQRGSDNVIAIRYIILLFQDSPNFVLSDLNMQLLDGAYNSLHNPHLWSFYSLQDRQERLFKAGCRTTDQKERMGLVEKNGPDEWIELFKLVITDSPIVDQEETGVEGGSVFTSIPTIQEIFAVQTTTQITITITMPIPTTQALSVMTGEYALSSSTSQASVNNTHHGAQR
ncbi:hypothetical protein J4Q44_G00138100 [Coregonus suidteri]|uniref:Uncharacterized protein n=1 Tax=Coregonus suidteri TaxID=861788 RepID=A0AAN8M3C9_9TELE